MVLEAFGVGNMPDKNEHGWLAWLKDQRKKGLQVGGGGGKKGLYGEGRGTARQSWSWEWGCSKACKAAVGMQRGK